MKVDDFNTSVVAEHAWNQSHQIDWDGATLLTSDSNLYCRLTLGSWHIHKSNHVLNREKGGLPLEYTPLLR